MRWAALFVVAAIAGCQCVAPDDRIYSCENTHCPDGLACIDGFCLAPDGGAAGGGSAGGMGGGAAGGGGSGGSGGGGVGGGAVGGGGGGGAAGGGVGGAGGDAGTDAGVDAGPPPSNDFCQNAITLSLVDGGASITGDLTAAKSDSSQCAATGPDVYYTFFGQAPITATVTKLDGGAWNPYVMLKASCAPSYLICGNNPATVSSGTALPNQYWVQVDATGGAGPFRLDVTAAPVVAGDVCLNAIPAVLGNNPATTVGAHDEESPSCGPWIASGGDIVFAFTVPDAGAGVDAGFLTAHVAIDAGREAVVEIHSGTSCPGTRLVCDNNVGSNTLTAKIAATPGPYLIWVGEHSVDGPFILQLTLQ